MFKNIFFDNLYYMIKKFFSKIMIVLVVAFLSINIFSGCSSGAVNYYITNFPERLVYEVGEEVDRGIEHVGIGNTLGGIFLILFKFFIIKNSEWNKYMFVKVLIFFVILIVCLVYTEIIVLNVFSLGDYTKGEIDKRGSFETRNMERQLSITDEEKDDKLEEIY